MTAGDRREELEAAVREALGRAYRYGLVTMLAAGNGGAPLGYPESAAEEKRLLAAFDACVASRDGEANGE